MQRTCMKSIILLSVHKGATDLTSKGFHFIFKRPGKLIYNEKLFWRDLAQVREISVQKWFKETIL
jgi:hypothetical protein